MKKSSNYSLSKKGFKIIIATAFIALLAGCDNKNDSTLNVSNSTLDQIKQRGVIRIAVFSDKPPFGYIDKAGNSQGYDVDLGRQIAKDLLGDENKVEFVLTEAQNRINVLNANKVDITLANFTVTPERAEQVDFALPYMKTAIGVVSPKSAPITDVSQLNGKTLIVDKGTTAETYFTLNHPEVNLQKYDSNSASFAALSDGRADGLAHDNTLLYAWAQQNPDYVVFLNKIGTDDVIAPAVKKGNIELLNWLNDEIKVLRKQEFFHKSYDHSIKPFYGKNVNPDNIVIDESNLTK